VHYCLVQVVAAICEIYSYATPENSGKVGINWISTSAVTSTLRMNLFSRFFMAHVAKLDEKDSLTRFDKIEETYIIDIWPRYMLVDRNSLKRAIRSNLRDLKDRTTQIAETLLMFKFPEKTRPTRGRRRPKQSRD
jgi:hypothetical protein